MLNKVVRLLSESVGEINEKEAMFKDLEGGNAAHLNSLKRPLLFAIEQAISCLNILLHYVSRVNKS